MKKRLLNLCLFALALTGCAAINTSPDPAAVKFTIPVKVTSKALISIGAEPGKIFVSNAPRGGCFNKQLSDSSWFDQAADATIQIIALAKDSSDRDGIKTLLGTGFIVENSGMNGKQNRIVSASHVVEDAERNHNGQIAILSSSGILLGTAEVVATADGFNQIDKERHNFRRGDQVVLEIKHFFKDGEQEYARIKGVNLAKEQAQNELKGLFDQPAGIAPGISGGPVFNADGHVIGIASSKQDWDNDDKWRVTKNVEAGVSVWNQEKQGFDVSTRNVALPVKAWGFFEPITDPKILIALGEAGKNVSSSREAPNHWDNVQAVGYPQQLCIVYKGSLDATR